MSKYTKEEIEKFRENKEKILMKARKAWVNGDEEKYTEYRNQLKAIEESDKEF